MSNVINLVGVGIPEGDYVWEKYSSAGHVMLYDATKNAVGADGANVCADITGGWEGVAGQTSTAAILVDGSKTATAPVIDFQATHLHSHVVDSNKGSFLTTVNKIDFTGFSKLAAFANIQGRNIAMTLSTTKSDGYTAALYEQKTLETPELLWNFELDISEIEDPYYVIFNFASSTSYWGHVYLYACYAFKEDDWETWRNLGGYDELDFATLAALLADSTALNALLADEDAVNYMLSCTGTLMYDATQSSTFRTALDSSGYKRRILANSHWDKFLTIAGYSA
jgi:hypothetical protein